MPATSTLRITMRFTWWARWFVMPAAHVLLWLVRRHGLRIVTQQPRSEA